MAGVTQIMMIVYGVFLIVGGIMGFAEAKSVPSLVAGTTTGILDLVAYVLSRTQPKTGFGLGLVVAILLIATQLPRYMKSHKLVPGLIALFSVLMVALLIASLMGVTKKDV